MKGYTTPEVAALVGLPEKRIRAYARAGLLTPDRGAHNQLIFSFQDLVLLRTAAGLEREQVPPRRIMDALTRLRAELPDGRSLSELRIHAAGDEVVVRECSEPPWNPQSGQFHFEFDVSELASRVAPLARAVSERAHASGEPRSAQQWHEMGLELEAVTPEEARSAYEAALRVDPAHADARINLGRLLHDAGRLAEAEASYRHVLSVREHALAAYNLGVVLEDQARPTDAIQAYARAIAADPQLAEAHYNLARLYEQRGDQRAAIRYFNGYRELLKRR